MSLFNLRSVTSKNVRMILHHDTPLLLSDEVAFTSDGGLVDESGILVEGATVFTDGFTVRLDVVRR